MRWLLPLCRATVRVVPTSTPSQSSPPVDAANTAANAPASHGSANSEPWQPAALAQRGPETTPTSAPHPGAPTLPRHARWVAAGLGLLWLKILLSCAWQGDDAFITHRTAANLVNGHGAVWNIGERVQSYTHPLWFALSTFCHAAFGEAYVSMSVISIVLMGVTVAAVGVGQSRDWRVGALAALALSCSAAVVDYGVSGLENPLVYVLLLAGLAACTRLPLPKEIFAAGLILTAVGLTRMDTLVLAGPPLLAMASGLQPRRKAWRPLLLASTPFLLWEMFSVFYYGTPVPNTAIAKLNLGIDKWDLAQQGMRYFAWTATHDPMTLLLIIGGIVGATWRGGRVERASAVGMALYLLYILRIGGDFMGGRFLAAPAVVGVALLARTLPKASGRAKWPMAAATVCVLLGLLWPGSRWLTDASYGVGRPMAEVVDSSGVADERAYYQPTTGLLRNLSAWSALRDAGLPIPPYPGARKGWKDRERRGVVVEGEVGFYGYFAGPGTYVVDGWALCDPLLARLPYHPGDTWRIGHYPRSLPAGYLDSLRRGKNVLKDPGLRAAYDDIRLVTRAPLLSDGRFAAIWRLNTGTHATALQGTQL